MIEISGLTKKFDKITALDALDLTVQNGSVTGLIGSNGGGKSTLLRILAGVFRPDSGSVLIDGERPFDNPKIKGNCYFVSDYPFFYSDSTLSNTAALYRRLYPHWSEEEFERCCAMFPIDRKQKILNMSKGMQRQAALIIALSTSPKYLFLDEIFDGLDAVVRLVLKRLLAERVDAQQLTVVIASHNLRELEDLCDNICLLHRGKVVVERDIDVLRENYRKVQIGFSQPQEDTIFDNVPVVGVWRSGNVFNLTLKGKEEDFMPQLEALQPAFISAMPLTLEEVFISEMEAAGYDANHIC